MVESLLGKRSPTLPLPAGRGAGRPRHPLRESLHLSPLNPKQSLLQWHCIFFFLMYFPTSLLVWGTGHGAAKMDYLDSLFFVITSGTGAGLNNVVVSQLNTFQQVVCFLLIFFGSPLFVASILVNVRRMRYKRWLGSAAASRRQSQDITREKDIERGHALPQQSSRKLPETPSSGVRFLGVDEIMPTRYVSSGDTTIVGTPYGGTPRRSSRELEKLPVVPVLEITPAGDTKARAAALPLEPPPGGDQQPSVSAPESETANFSSTTREKTYSALCTLSWVVPAYYLAFQFLAGIALGGWIVSYRPNLTPENGVQPWWWAFFNSVSAFNNSGMSLLDANMVPFQRDGKFVLLTQSLLILAGNSCFPVFLRLIVWTFSKIVKKDSFMYQGLDILGDEKKGRLVYPYIFSSLEVWWLAGTIFVLNGVDWAAFEIAAPSSGEVSALPIGDRLATGFFQACSVRSGGFAAVSIRDLHIGVQFLYVAMMYISTYPLVLNPYYEAEKPGQRSPSRSSTLRLIFRPQMLPQTLKTFLKHQFRGLMRAGDLSWLAFCAWIIAIVESGKITADPQGFSVFAIFFEVASAYGCVGVSLGDPSGRPLAFVGAWKGASKIVLAIVMLGGRLREVRRGVLVGDWGVGGRGVDGDYDD